MNPPFRPAADRPARPADARDTAGGSHTAAQSAHPPREPQPGEVVGNYRVLRELGRGGMAVVFEAEDTELPRRVALKVLADADPNAKLRFVREAHAQAKVHHENVVTIFRVGEDRGVSYIAMPVLKGQSLAQALDATPRPPLPAVLRIAAEMAEGLAAAHAVGLIHRDIKPSNIWLEAPKWRVKILDFGLARAPQNDSLGDITLRGQVLGTPAYMSPEQTAGHAVDARTDLWSLGVVLYQMTTGEKPFAGDTSLNLMTAIVTAEPRPPLALAPDLPSPLCDLILRLLAKSPVQRPGSAADVAAELNALVRAVPSPSMVSAPAVVWQPPAAPTAVLPALPSAVSTPAAPADPWDNIEATEADVRPVRRSSRDDDNDDDGYDDRPRRKRRDRDRDEDDAPPRSLKGVWIGLLSATALLLVGALVVMAVKAVSPNTATTEKGKDAPPVTPQPQPKPPPKQPPPETDRPAAEALIASARLKVQIDGRSPVEVPARGQLPAGRLTITEIDFEANDAVGPVFVSNTLLPALAQLRALTEIRMRNYQMTIAPEHLRQMAAMPLASTLTRLDAQVELTNASSADLRKFTAMEDLTVSVPNPSDALFERLADLSRLKILAFHSLSPAAGLTDRGWGAIAGMSLTLVSLVESPAAPDALRGLTIRRTVSPPPLGFVACDALTDDHLRQLGERTTDVQFLLLRGGAITNAGLLHLKEVSSLRAVSVQRSRATEAGARALYAARPDMRVLYDEKLIDRKN